MNKKVKLKGSIKIYLQWPLILTILIFIMNGVVFAIDRKAGGAMATFTFIYIVFILVLYLRTKNTLMNDLITFATQYGQIQKKLLLEMKIPYAILDDDGKLLWMNKEFAKIVKKDRYYRKSITGLFPNITKDLLPNELNECQVSFEYESRDYEAQMKKVSMDSVLETTSIVKVEAEKSYIIAMYLFDRTELNSYIKENKEQRLVTGLIYLDNYEEALESVEEVRRSLLIALIDRKINKYISGMDGIVKKLEKDKYFVVMKQKCLDTLQSNKFSILDEVKTVNIGNEMAVTLSIGFGVNGSTYIQNYAYARTAIDLALGRGGDQAVLKDNDKIYYYGGKTKQVEKSTRVKARVKAHALRELMEANDKIIVMGHKIGDVDSFGASIGIYRAAKTLNKKAYIVINDITTSVRPLLECFVNNQDYDEDMFVTSSEALELVDNNTVVTVVDVNKPSYTECEELLKRARTIVVLDHHRQGVESIENAVLSYVETYASSACEMVAEILQYFDDSIKIKGVEADCLYAGIMIDTNNFMSKTGVRTFEAAAFLRRCGSDVSRVRKMFRDDMITYKARAEAVRHAEVYREFAISVCPTGGLESPTVVGAQAANELLNIIGVKASIVLTEYNGKIYVSARSIDEINVQLIMEKLGGGGHLNVAGAQLECNINDAKSIIKETLDIMLDNGELS
ncbi:c-di-AMP phosphodiesterase-like protein [Lachnotalea glycerini]|uniref:Cyclic-di-AMP phosphodiesterase n=1 Tax=Lachnotalea glycerini TaxID=1763509 RepID=A0A255I042_9FIRM|nr:DHH family phosphoesterase [Lachnotalea glycerini]PXV90996.1 c-di-AMP phosphodiesterase-like protein [Lachnotalea glycerini]RDY28116.1 DHH family phosphoesterase [Lachnotalea glycerini]